MKKSIANLIMAVIIVGILSVGILAAGFLLGWFDSRENNAVLTDLRGIVTMERGGVRYSAGKNTPLRENDLLIVESGGSASIEIGGSALVLNSGTTLRILSSKATGFSARIDSGEVFCHSGTALTLSFADRSLEVSDSTLLLSVRARAQSVCVLGGTVGAASAGQRLSWIDGEASMDTLSKESLSAFSIGCMRTVLKSQPLCFTVNELDALEAARLADKQHALEDLLNPTVPAPSQEPTAPTEPSAPQAEPTVETTPPPPTTNPLPTETSPAPTKPEPLPTQPVKTCTLTIRCDTILNNFDKLDPGKAGLVPADGILLHATTVRFFDGESVFDILKRACTAAGIPLEYMMSAYGSYYVEGIGGLYEFDCGSSSGWMYKVNGWFPNYGCSEYAPESGDNIVWCYTCEGYGSDVGAPER